MVTKLMLVNNYEANTCVHVYACYKIIVTSYDNSGRAKHMCISTCTVEPLIVDPLNKEHNRNNLSIKDTSLGLKYSLSHTANTF